jgi:fatty-acyl-CoA synthase
MLVQSAARVLVVSADLVELALQVAERAPKVAHVLVADGPAPALRLPRPVVATLADLIDGATGEVVWGDFDETAPSGLCFTSGTTGAPKGVTYTHRSSFLHTLRLLQADVMALTSTDAVMAVVPMFHANAWGLPFAAPACGAKLVLPGRHSDGASLARLINDEGVTVAAAVPTVWLGLVEHLEASGGEVPTLKRILVGGAPMPPALMARIEARLGVSIQTSWGMTELSPLGTMAAPEDPARTAAASGRPAIGVDLLLKDASGEPLADQRSGEGRLHVRGAAVVDRYFGQDDAATDADGWFDTGDLARIDAAGQLHITGRSKDLIKSGGEWINPVEIETVVGALPEVSLVAVIGRVDPKWGERPILLVETRDGAAVSDDQLLAPLRGRVAPWWIPDAVVRLANMPLAPTGKIDKMRLRSEYGGA